MRSNKGITLIALIITIIVMLILVMVSISIALNTGLFDATGKATQKWDTEQDAEKELAEGKVNIDNKIYNSVDEYVESIGKKSLQIGDYVNYTPEGTLYSTSYTIESKYSGYDSEQIAYLQDTKWRIVNINEDGTIELISEKGLYIGNSSENTEYLYLKGATGYNNGVEILNDLCNNLYGTGEGAISARSIKIEDIQQKMDRTVWDWEDWYHISHQSYSYGSVASTDYVPSRYCENIGASINGELIAWDIDTNGELLNKTYIESSEGFVIDAWDKRTK